MKIKYLIILTISTILVLLLIPLVYYIYVSINYVPHIDNVDVAVDGTIIKNFILENEKIDNTLKTFINLKDIDIINHQENVEYYALILIDTYNEENQLLKHKQSIKKLYKFILDSNAQIISSDSSNVKDISEYSVFPKNIIEKYIEIKNSFNFEEIIKKEIDYYYMNIGNKKEKNIYYFWL